MSRVEVALGLNGAEFRQGLERAKGVVKNFGAAAQKGLNVGRLLGAGVAVAGLDRILDRVERLEDAAVRLNVPVQFIQELESLGDRVQGVDLDNLVEFLQDVNEKAIDAASGSGEAAEAFELLGLSAEEFRDMDLREQFLGIADAVAQATDKQAAIAAVMKIGSDEATKLLPLLRQGGDAIEEMTRGMESFSSASVSGLRGMRDELRGFNRDAQNFVTRGVGGAFLIGRGLVRGLSGGGTFGQGFRSSFEDAIDRERQGQIQANRDRLGRQETLEAQAEERRREAARRLREEEDRNAAAFGAGLQGVSGRSETITGRLGNVEDSFVRDAIFRNADEVARRLAREGNVEELEAAREKLRAAEEEVRGLRAVSGPNIDSLTAVGLGAGGVNYALGQSTAEQRLRSMDENVKKIAERVEDLEATIELEADEFGGGS